MHTNHNQQLAVDYIFCTTLVVLLQQALSKDNLSDYVAVQIEQYCFEQFKADKYELCVFVGTTRAKGVNNIKLHNNNTFF